MFTELRAETLPMLLLLVLGGFLTIRFGFFQVRGLPFILKNTLFTLLKKDNKSKTGISSFQAVSTALAGTMGVGNIAGVATALVAGGPGAIFWMWISAFFGMMTKYAEIYLAVRYRKKKPEGFAGGPMYYMEAAGMKRLAVIFSILCVFSSFGIGNMTQVNSVSSSALSAFSIPLWITGLIVAGFVALVIFGGAGRIVRINELIIPFISIAYLCISTVILYRNRSYLVPCLSQIFHGAFGLDKASGGILGYTVSQSVRLGLSRGVFTNEAGLGSAPIAHAAADTKSPAHQGVWGIFEVFLDTIAVCTVTALVILTANGGALWRSGLDGAILTSAAFESAFGEAGGKFIAVSIALFAVPSMLGWCFYGESALNWLTGGKKQAITAYRWLFVLCAGIGAMAELRAVWAMSDLLNAFMALPNIVAIIVLRGQIRLPQDRPSTLGM